MKKSHPYAPLALAVATLLASPLAFADDKTDEDPIANLGTLQVTTDRQGAKSKTNVMTQTAKNKRTETDLRGLLSEEPAITVGGGNSTSQWWTIRGMGQDQIDVKVDNAYSDTQIFHHQGRFMLDPALVKIVSVQKGAGSASAGIGATSGAIVAKTLDAKELLAKSENQNFGFTVNSGLSSNKGYNYGGSVFGKVGAFDVLLSANQVINKNYKGGKGYTNLDGNDVVKNSALDQLGLLAKIGYDINDNHRLVASYRQEYSEGTRALREEFDFSQDRLTASRLSAAQIAAGYVLTSEVAGKDRSGATTYYVKDANGNYVSNDANNNPRYREYKQETTMLEYTGKNLGFADKVEANIYEMKVSRQEETSLGSGVMNPATEVKTAGANVNFDSSLGSWAGADMMIKYGANYRKQEGLPSGIKNQEKTDTGLYGEMIGYMGNFTLTGGLRYDHFDYTATNGTKAKDGDFNPSLGVIYQVTPSLSFSANHNYATRSPRLREVLISGGNTVGIDSNIKAEKAQNTEVGFNYNDGNFSANGSYFWQDVKHAHGIQNNVILNAGEVKNKGYELGVGYRFKGLVDGLSARASVAYQEPETYGNLGDSTLYAVQIGRTWTTNLAYQFQNYPVELGWRGRLVEKAVGTPSRGSSNSTTEQVLNGYNVHDFYVNYRPHKNDKFNINFAINNAFDENYKPHSQRAGVNSLPGAGRDFRIGVNYQY